METTVIWSYLRRLRQAIQILVLALYIYLLFAASPQQAALPLADLFFRLDPLAAIGAMLASRAWLPRLALALITVGLTLVLGRVWCGWLCPLGTLLDWITPPGGWRTPAARRTATLSPRWRMVKNIVLLVILAMALFGSLSLLIFDPLALLTRTMTTAILPALNYAVTAVERAMYPIPFLRPVVDWAETVLRGPVLSVEQPVFSQNAFIIMFFFGILALNFLAGRFWCRYLCPLGALLGLLSKVSLLRPVIRPACTGCAKCARVCQVDAIETGQDYEIVPAECTVCLDCLAACPQGGMGFHWQWRPAPLRETDPTRRQVLAGLASGVVGVAVLRSGVQAKQPHPRLIRPPGVEDEADFLSRCLRCSQCMAVCPTSGLQPALFEAGLEGLWTPKLAPRLGHCDYGCHACGQVCPSGAIPSLDLEPKRQAVIGLAVVDRNRCLPWAYDTACIVCEEMCPTPEKAIKLEEITVTNEQGQVVVLQRPYVVADLCIGCGTCERQCPLESEAAIEIYRQQVM
jgi:MauM/NapG family ferredoxin protein